MGKRAASYSSLLGIGLESGRMTAVWLRRSAGGVQVRKTLQAALSLDPARNDPELVGREIRNRLAEADIREHRCVVCVPLNWALTLRTDLPDLSEQDTANYLNLQAERGFPFAPEDLSMAVSRYRTPGGANQAMIAAIPSTRVNALLRAFKAARLRPVSITLGITALLEKHAALPPGSVALLVGGHALELAIPAGSGIAALRPLDEAVETEGEGQGPDAVATARQLRITLGQLPPDLRETIRTVRVFGPSDVTEPFCAELRDLAGPMALSVELGNGTGGVRVSGLDARSLPAPSVLSAATGRLLGGAAALEFLPPRTSRLKQISGRISSRATRVFGAAAAAAVLILAIAFIYQDWRLSRLESRWNTIEPQVSAVAALQDQVRRFRPWFDDSAQSLAIARSLAEAFPEAGDVWAEWLEIKEQTDSGRLMVSCRGKARNNREWLQMLERLRQGKGIEDLRFQQVRGEDPLQFSLSFLWNAGGTNGR